MAQKHQIITQAGRHARHFILVLLVIEFLDEWVYGAREAALPLIRDDLSLTYAQIGLLLGLPTLCSAVLEPVVGILGDMWSRRVLVVGGGLCFAAMLLMTGTAHTFPPLLMAYSLLSPASGAFVSLSQATLMDLEPERRENNMARWTFAGSLGVVGGPLFLGLMLLVGWGWRGMILGFALVALALALLASRMPFPPAAANAAPPASLWSGLREAWRVMWRSDVLRWLVLLRCSDLMLDVLLGFLALYCVDVVGVTAAQATTAVAVWTGVGLLGDFLLIPLLERVSGLRYLRVSAVVELCLYLLFLVIPNFVLKLVVLGLLGFFNSGWYSILQARFYATLPGRSGTAMAVHNLFGLMGAFVPWGLGLVAHYWDLRVTMVLLFIGPLGLLVGLPRREPSAAVCVEAEVS